MGSGTKYSQSTATQTLPSYLQGAYENIIGKAQGTAATPYEAYTGGFTPDQQAAFGNIASMWGKSDPAFGNASTALSSSMVPTYNEVGAYMNPYISGVINPMMDVMQEQNQRQQQGVVGNAIAKGAMGGNRVGVAQGELARQQKLADNQALGQLYQQGYSGAMSAAQADKAAKLQAAGQYAGLGQTQMETALAQAGAQLGAGTQQQQFDYQQYLNKLAFPYQQQSWLASIAGGLAPSAGGTTTESKPQGNIFSQLLGAGLGIASLFRDGGVVPHRARGGRNAADDLAGDPVRIMRPNPFGMGFDYDASPRLNKPVRQGDWLDIFRGEERDDLDELWSPLNGIESEYVTRLGRAEGGVVPHMAMGGMPYANDNGMWPSYASGFGAMPGANDNGQFGSYIPKVASIGGGGRGFPTISADREEKDPFAISSSQMKKGAGNIKSWLGGTDASKVRMPSLYADGGVVGRNAYAGGGVPMIAAPALFDETFAATELPDDVKRKLIMESLQRDPTSAAFREAPARPAAVTAIDAVSPLDNANLGLGYNERPAVVAEAAFDPASTLSPANVERGPMRSEAVGVVPARGEVVPFDRGRQFMTAPEPGYSENIGDAWESLTAGKGLNLSPDMRQALLAAGMGMMSSKSPFALAGIGEGGLTGIETWNARQALERENAAARASNAMTGAGITEALERAGLTREQSNLTSVQADILPFDFTPTMAGMLVTDKANPSASQIIPFSQLGGWAESRGIDPSQLPNGGKPVEPKLADDGVHFDVAPPPNASPSGMGWTPTGQQILGSRTTKMLEQSYEAAAAAREANLQLISMKNAAEHLPATGILAQGDWAKERGAIAKSLNTLAQMSGAALPFDPNQVASIEEMNKLTTQFGFNLARTTGSDVASAVISQGVGAVPSIENTPQGFRAITSVIQAGLNRSADYDAFLNAWADQTGGDLTGAEHYFNQVAPPSAYADAAILSSAIIPKTQEDIDKAPAGTLFNIDGQLMVK